MSMREDRYQSMVEKLAAEIAEEAMQDVVPEEEIDEETLDAIAEEVVAQAEAEEAAAEGEEEAEEAEDSEEDADEEIKEAAYYLASEIVKEAGLGKAVKGGLETAALKGMYGADKAKAFGQRARVKANIGAKNMGINAQKKQQVKDFIKRSGVSKRDLATMGIGAGAGASGAYALNKQAAAPAMFKNLAQQIKAVPGGIKANASSAGLRVKDLGKNSLSKIDGAVINNPYKAIAAAAGIGGATGYAIGNNKEAEIYEAAIEKAASVFEEGLAIEKAALNAYKTAQIQKEAAELIFSELGLLD